MLWKLVPNDEFWSLRTAAVRNRRSPTLSACSMNIPNVFWIVVPSLTVGMVPDPTIVEPGASCVEPVDAPKDRKPMYWAPTVVFMANLDNAYDAVEPTSTVVLLMFTRLMPRAPRRVVAVSGGPSPRSSRFSSLRPVKSLPTVARFASQLNGRQLAPADQMKRFTSWLVFSCHM